MGCHPRRPTVSGWLGWKWEFEGSSMQVGERRNMLEDEREGRKQKEKNPFESFGSSKTDRVSRFT